MSSTHDGAGQDRWIRSKGQSVGLMVFVWFEVALGSFGILGAAVVSDGVLWGRIVVLVSGALLLVLAWVGLRASRAGARAEALGLRIKGVWRETFIAWADIERFSLGRHGYFPYVARIHLRDGSIVAIFGIQAPNIAPRNRRTAALIERLEEERRRHTDATG